MGEEIEIEGKPRIAVRVQGTDTIEEVALIRDGSVIHTLAPKTRDVRFEHVDGSFPGKSYYYVRIRCQE